ncbi:SRA stem-loop-interacting RNA-binding protein [Aphelenchoides avenae]|nr:SRA stem-loop-interacting RNA-binding protein [Aphelenchus avenae]
MRFSLVALARTVVNTVPKDDVMVRNVHWITGKGQLREYMAQFGDVRTVRIPLNRHTGFHRGFAFVSFASKDSVRKVLAQRDHVIDGTNVVVDRPDEAGTDRRESPRRIQAPRTHRK